MSKRYVLSKEDIEQRAPGRGTAAASDEITVAGRAVGYMYREEPDEEDSGWRFLSGDESQEYLDDERHVGVFDVNVIANMDDAVIPYLDAPPGTHLVRVEGSDEFVDADDVEDAEDEDDWEEIDADTIDTIDDLRERDDL